VKHVGLLELAYTFAKVNTEQKWHSEPGLPYTNSRYFRKCHHLTVLIYQRGQSVDPKLPRKRYEIELAHTRDYTYR